LVPATLHGVYYCLAPIVFIPTIGMERRQASSTAPSH
jgi:hypothetical protein